MFIQIMINLSGDKDQEEINNREMCNNAANLYALDWIFFND